MDPSIVSNWIEWLGRVSRAL